jgi:phytoene dehydrogenase-like protein
VATDLRAAAKLLERPDLDWPAPRTAMFDVALTPHRRDKPQVLDLDRRVYVSNYSAYDASLAPDSEQLYQAIAGLRDGEDLASAVARIHAVLDLAAPGWRERTTWKRQGLSDGAGAADPPGTTWRDRPAIEQGDDRWLAGDRTAAPGLLCETAFHSGRAAAEGAMETLVARRRGTIRAVA